MQKKLPDVKIKRQLLDHYIKGICSLTSCFGIYTIEIRSPNAFHNGYLIQTDDVDIELLKVLTQYIKNIQHQNSQRANSLFTNDVLSNIYSYLSILELMKPQTVHLLKHPDIQLYDRKYTYFQNFFMQFEKT